MNLEQFLNLSKEKKAWYKTMFYMVLYHAVRRSCVFSNGMHARAQHTLAYSSFVNVSLYCL